MANEQELLSGSEIKEMLDEYWVLYWPSWNEGDITEDDYDSGESYWTLEAQIAKLKDMGYEQVWTKCPDCMNGQIMTGHRVWHPCPTCKGIGRIYKYVKWDREKVARYLFKKGNGFPNARFYPNWEDEVQACSLTGEEYLTIADQLKEELGKEGG